MAMTKYRAKPTKIDGIRFASKREAKRYQELKLLFRAGLIRELQLQPEIDCIVEDKHLFTYRADFSYWENGKNVIEDVKGFKTPVYRLKKRIIEALYNIKITET
jgi:hypothetical protein